MALDVPIGISDFRTLREKGLTYVDKSGLIIEMLDRPGAQVLLLPRPRRFGKTLNLSMLKYFFEKRSEDISHLFEGLAVWEAGEKYRAHFQRYPTIFITFRDAKGLTYEECWSLIKENITALFGEHRALLSSGALEADEARRFEAILDGTADPVLYSRALGDLSKYLHRATGERAIILIDEYDQPIHAGHVNGYGKEILNFFRQFMTTGLKDNPHLERGVVTGILRIARESIFSGLNNLAVCTLLEPAFSTCFGFTEPEVISLLEKAGRSDRLGAARTWYNGYIFGDTVIYNPWSILNFLAWGGEPKPYWLNTSSNDLVKVLLQARAVTLQETFESLLSGGGLERLLDENVILDDLERSDDALWSLLVFSGYLRAERRPPVDPDFPAMHWLTIPNREVRTLYTGTFRTWMERGLEAQGGRLDVLLRALLGGDTEQLGYQIGAFVKNILSYHDVAVFPEAAYQSFILGLLSALEPGHRVRSNRESGKGRPDVMIVPSRPGSSGVILELKVAKKGKTLDQVLDEGTKQVRAKEYEAELKAAGAEPIHVFVVAFDGKEARVRNLADQPP